MRFAGIIGGMRKMNHPMKRFKSHRVRIGGENSRFEATKELFHQIMTFPSFINLQTQNCTSYA